MRCAAKAALQSVCNTQFNSHTAPMWQLQQPKWFQENKLGGFFFYSCSLCVAVNLFLAAITAVDTHETNWILSTNLLFPLILVLLVGKQSNLFFVWGEKGTHLWMSRFTSWPWHWKIKLGCIQDDFINLIAQLVSVCLVFKRPTLQPVAVMLDYSFIRADIQLFFIIFITLLYWCFFCVSDGRIK